MKPADKRRLRNKAEDAEREAQRMQGILAKFKPGSVPYQHIESRLEKAKREGEDAKYHLKRARGK